MNKIFLILMLLCFLPLHNEIFSQENFKEKSEYRTGIRAGLNFHNTYGSSAGGDIGLYAGYYLISRKRNLIRWQCSVHYIEHGSKRVTTIGLGGEKLTSIINRNYISMPLSINLDITKFLGVHGGGYLSTTLKKNLILESDSNGRQEIDLVDSSPLDAGIFFGANLFLSKNFGLSVDYYHGLFNTYQGFDQTLIAKNRSIAVSLNYQL